MAEFIMKDIVRRNGMSDVFKIESCATSDEEIGHDIYPPAKDVLNKHGIPYEKRRARRMTSADYDRFDRIVAMDRWNIRNMRGYVGGDPDGKVSLMMSHAGKDMDVDDPWYSGDFERTYEEITEACSHLFESMVGLSDSSH